MRGLMVRTSLPGNYIRDEYDLSVVGKPPIINVKRIDQIEAVMEVAPVKAVVFSELVIESDYVLAPILRIVWLKRRIVCRISI